PNWPGSGNWPRTWTRTAVPCPPAPASRPPTGTASSTTSSCGVWPRCGTGSRRPRTPTTTCCTRTSSRSETDPPPSRAPSAGGGDGGLDVREVGAEDLLERGAAVRAEGTHLAGEVGQRREAFGVRAEHRDTEQLHALLVLLGTDAADRGLGGDQRDDEDREPVIPHRDLLLGQSRRAQRLQHLFHDEPGAGPARGVPCPDRRQLGLPAEGLA